MSIIKSINFKIHNAFRRCAFVNCELKTEVLKAKGTEGNDNTCVKCGNQNRFPPFVNNKKYPKYAQYSH